MANTAQMRIILLFNGFKISTYDWFLGSETIFNILRRILKSLLLEVDKGLQFLNRVFTALLPIIFFIWILLWIINLEELKGLQKYIKWWVLFCFVMISISQGLSFLINAKID